MDTISPNPATLADTGYHAVLPLPLDAGFQSRWDAWIERGRVHDRRVRHRLVVSGAVLGMTAVAAAIIYTLFR
jgi:hypothetical protein